MAKRIQNNNEPYQQNYNNSGSTIIKLFLVIAIFSCGTAYYFTSSLLAVVISIVLLSALIGIIIANALNYTYIPRSKIYGNQGEEIAGSILEQYLPDDYTVIQNTIISYDGESEIDNIVVGKTGVFIIEVKNMKGTISGDCENKDWLQQKTDRYGIEHQKYFYNPVKQVGTHIYRLANYLRDNKIFTHIKGAVYFANSNTSLSIHGDNDNIPVFSFYSQNEMIDYIKEGTANLSDKTIERIIQLLN